MSSFFQKCYILLVTNKIQSGIEKMFMLVWIVLLFQQIIQRINKPKKYAYLIEMLMYKCSIIFLLHKFYSCRSYTFLLGFLWVCLVFFNLSIVDSWCCTTFCYNASFVYFFCFNFLLKYGWCTLLCHLGGFIVLFLLYVTSLFFPIFQLTIADLGMLVIYKYLLWT